MPSRGTYVLPNGTHSAAMPNFAFELGNLSVGQHELIIQHRIDAACSFEQLQPKDVLKLARICALSEVINSFHFNLDLNLEVANASVADGTAHLQHRAKFTSWK